MRLPLIISLAASISVILCFDGCSKRQRLSTYQQSTDLQTNRSSPAAKRININTASANELETLPGIGEALAARIIEHREKYGPFRKPEHLIVVRGISDRRFRALREFITVE